MACTEENRYNFAIQQGDDVEQPFRYLTDGEPIDLNGVVATFECAIPALTHNMTIPAPASLGELVATFARADTAGLTQRRVPYEVVLWHGGFGVGKETAFWGSLTLDPEKVL